MHPILSSPRWLGVYVAAWLPVGGLLALSLGGDVRWTTAASLLVPLTLVQALLALPSYYVCLAFPLGSGAQAWRAAVAHLVAATTTSGLWVALGGVWATTLDGSDPSGSATRLYTDQRASLVVVGGLLFLIAAGLHYAVLAVQTSQANERRAVELELLSRRAELAALRAQIDPHFLFNSLHSIGALTATDPPAAQRMCVRLADFLRDTLRRGRESRLSLDEELGLSEQYLGIEQVRFGARLRVDVEATPEARRCSVPPLLLQPIVENAVVHGIGQVIDGGTVRVTGRRERDDLVITVTNPYDPTAPGRPGQGLGLDLIRRRLVTEYGTAADVRATAEASTFRVDVRLPATDAEAATHDA